MSDKAGSQGRAKGKGRKPKGGQKHPPIPLKLLVDGRSGEDLPAEAGSGPEAPTITPTPRAGTDLASRAERINQHHAKRLKAFRTCLGHARDAGAELVAAKEAVGHGNFQEWLKGNCAFSYETAANYMRIATHWDELTERFASKSGIIADLGIVKALAHIAKTKPQAAGKHDVGNATEGPEARNAGGGPSGSANAGLETGDPGDEDAIEVDPSGLSGGSPSGRGGEQADRLEKAGRTPPASSPAGPNPEQQGAGAGLQENRGEGNAKADEADSTQTDERHLGRFPLRTALVAHDNTATFDAQASLQRRMRPEIERLSRLYRPSEQDFKALERPTKFASFYSCRLALLLGVKPPDEWALCERCGGAGKNGSSGSPCGRCEGAGYRMTDALDDRGGA